MTQTLDISVELAIRRYGFVVAIDQACEIVGCVPATFRDKVRAGVYPKPFRRGRWATEAVVRAMEGTENDTTPDPEDPYDLDLEELRGAIFEDEDAADGADGILVLPRSAA